MLNEMFLLWYEGNSDNSLNEIITNGWPPTSKNMHKICYLNPNERYSLLPFHAWQHHIIAHVALNLTYLINW